MQDQALFSELATTLPDQPRWVEARGLLRSGRCDVLRGFGERSTAGFLVVDLDRPLVCAVHRPVAALLEELFALHPDHSQVLAPLENAEHLRSLLGGWTLRPATIHIHPDPGGLPGATHDVRWLTREDEPALAHLPRALLHEVERALDLGPTVATFADGRPVSFATVAYETERWWDLSVDTLDEHRRRGYASSAAAFLIRHMLERGKEPVWGALDANEASLALAAKYGFRAVDRLAVFTRGSLPERPPVG